jgi:hypothetical protein
VRALDGVMEYWLVTSDGPVNKQCIKVAKKVAKVEGELHNPGAVEERGLRLIETVGDERVRRIVTPGRYTLGDSTQQTASMLSARNDP